jgi:hypothetical protein
MGFIKEQVERTKSEAARRSKPSKHRFPILRADAGAFLHLPHRGLGGRGNAFLGELVAKRLELLHELVPKAVRVPVLVNPANGLGEEAARMSPLLFGG